MATQKQLNLIQNMIDVLDNEFDFGSVGQKKFYSVPEASELITINRESFYNILDFGQCTVRQYNILTKIAGRKPKFERHQIGYSTAVDWIEKYYKKSEVA